MTVLAGIVSDGNVWIGGDSLSSTHYRGAPHSEGKVFFNDEFLIGSTGSVRVKQILKYALIPPENTRDSIMEYMVLDFMNAVRLTLEAAGCLEKENEIESGGEFLAGYRGRLFHVYDDFQVGETSWEYDTAGIGDELALGALSVMTDHVEGPLLTPPERLVISLSAACQFSPRCGGPLTILTTDTRYPVEYQDPTVRHDTLPLPNRYAIM